jgi:hypothetical protein
MEEEREECMRRLQNRDHAKAMAIGLCAVSGEYGQGKERMHITNKGDKK